MKEVISFMDKIVLYLIFFIIADNCKPLIKWMNMSNMTDVMILMSVVMLVNMGWSLYHAGK